MREPGPKGHVVGAATNAHECVQRRRRRRRNGWRLWRMAARKSNERWPPPCLMKMTLARKRCSIWGPFPRCSVLSPANMLIFILAMAGKQQLLLCAGSPVPHVSGAKLSPVMGRYLEDTVITVHHALFIFCGQCAQPLVVLQLLQHYAGYFTARSITCRNLRGEELLVERAHV
jgi:hypothetical protein